MINVHSSTTIRRLRRVWLTASMTMSMGEAKCTKVIKNTPFFYSRNVARHALSGVATWPCSETMWRKRPYTYHADRGWG